MVAYRLAQVAESQLDHILARSAGIHGEDAAFRYNPLLLNAMAAVAADPHRLGSIPIPGLQEVRAYPARLIRFSAATEDRVCTPRHLVIYRMGADGVVDILGLAHDRMVLSRAARRAVEDADEP